MIAELPEMASRAWLSNLNPAQQAAVMHGSGPLLVVAGAGTGKTMTLASRVAWLIEQGTPPERILLLTFTRRAASEMLRRAGQLIGQETAARVWGGTFHATANRLLRIYGAALNLAPEFTVMDEADAADLMNLLRNELGFVKAKRRFPRKNTLVSIYSRTVNAGEKLFDALNRHFPWCREDADAIREIFELYVTRKREHNVLDYDDLLLFWRVLSTTPGVGDAIAGRFEHILVDEYQDTNSIQADILAGMRRSNKNIMVVGDDAQSIYSFRAATVRNILDFPAAFPGATVVKLEQNYRSTQPILDASNAVMAYASERYTKELWSERRSQQKPVLVHCVDEPDQCTIVCGNILGHLEEGVALMKQAVLFRAGHHSDQLEIELARRNIPFHKFGGLKFIETAHIKDMLALLRILENPHDQISWFRVLHLLEGIGPRSARRIMDSLGVGQLRRSDNDADASPLRRLASHAPAVPAPAEEQFVKLRDVLLDLTANAESIGLPLPVQIERLRKFYEPIFKQVYENAVIRLGDLEQLQHIAQRYQSRRRFITDLTLDPPSSTSDLAGPPHLDEDYLILSTMHSAKGCEWDVVHVIHAADGMIPSDMSVADQAGVDEERRLFYVAMTRARNMLYVYFPLRYYHRRYALGDGHNYAQLTRFITPAVQPLFEQRSAGGATTTGCTDDAAGEAVKFGPSLESADTWLRQLWR